MTERRRGPFSRYGAPGLLVCLACLFASASAQSITITAPAPSAVISGTAYTFKASVSNAPSACSVEWLVNGDSQAIVFAAPWSLNWNTNNRYNSGGTWHTLRAILRDCLNNTLASATNQFEISNSYIETPAQISLATVTTSNGSGGSGCATLSTWSGTCTISFTVTGSNAGDLKLYILLVDGILVTQNLDQTNTSFSVSVNTAQYLNGPHLVGLFLRDQGNSVVGNYGFPFGEWQQVVAFSNGSAAMELHVSPHEWLVSPNSTQALTCKVGNADGSTSSCSSPSYSSGNTSVCTVNSSGTVTGVAYGSCPINITANGLSRTIYGYVSSTNVIPHFSTSGIVKSNGAGLFVTSMFANSANVGFSDPVAPQAMFGAAYQLGGFNTLEGGVVGGSIWGTSQSNFTSSISPIISSTGSILNTYNLNFLGDTESLWTGSNPYLGIRGIGSTYSPPAWQLLAQNWKSGLSGRLLGFIAFDEGTNAFAEPVFSPPNAPVINSGGPFSGITCNSASPVICTVAWINPSQNGPGGFAIFGATTHAVLNSTIGGSLYAFQNWGATGFQFQAPSGAAGITVTASSDPSIRIEPFAFQWENNNTDYLHYQDFATAGTLLANAGVAMCGAPAAGAYGVQPLSFLNAILYSWIANPALDTCGNVYYSPTIVFNPQFEEINLNVEPQPGAPNLSLLNNMRVAWGAAQSPPLLLGLGSGTTMDYGFTPVSTPISSIAGPLVTFASPHGISNVIPGVSRMMGSASSNAYFNTNIFIDSCPTATTCKISMGTLEGGATPVQTPNPGTITFSNGDTITHAYMCSFNSTCSGGPVCGTSSCGFFCSSGNAGDCIPNDPNYTRDYGLTFTWSGSGADPYWTSHTFIWANSPLQPTAQSQHWREVPLSSKTSGAMTGLVNANHDYIRGVQHNFAEAVLGPRMPFSTIIASALTGASGVRDYSLGGDYTMGALTGSVGLTWNSTSNMDVQASATPLYPNGEAGTVQVFWATTAANVLLQRFANSGYLYQPRAGCPDVAPDVECTLRAGPKGNLLITLNVQDYAQTRTVDLSACAVSGQSTIKYSADWRGIDVSSIGTVASDTATWQPGMAIAYLCALNQAAEFAPTVLAAALSDVPNATQIVVRYSHIPYMLTQRTNNVINCNTGTCSIPWDRSLGPLYYQLQYLNSAGSVLATSDLQTL